ncbi:MAG: IS110 family transposase [bacterium]
MPKIASIKELYQLKETIKNNGNTMLVGFDVSKEYSDMCFMDSAHNILLKNFRFSNNRKGFNSMLNKIYVTKDVFGKQDIFCGFEPTGQYHKPLAAFLLQKDLPVCQISTMIAKDNRRTLDGSWRKNDAKDALNVTDLMSQGKVLYYPTPSPFYDGLKSLISYRYKLSRQLLGMKAMIRNSFFCMYFPEIESLYDNILHQEILFLLKHFPTAYQIQKISLNKFIKMFNKDKIIAMKAKERLRQVWLKAQDSIGCEPNISTYVIANNMVNQIEFIQNKLSSIEYEIDQLCKHSKDYELLQTIPGFGPINSATFMACVKNIDRYNNIRQIEKRAGFDLEHRQSGMYKGHLSISKKGNALLRYALCSAANAALKNKVFKDLFLKKLEIKGVCRDNKFKLRIKCAEKLLRIACAVIKNTTPFSIEHILQNSVEQPVLTNVRAA